MSADESSVSPMTWSGTSARCIFTPSSCWAAASAVSASRPWGEVQEDSRSALRRAASALVSIVAASARSRVITMERLIAGAWRVMTAVSPRSS